ncbi:MAG: D-alanyl-D-alanine carboxypeptidase/D-alanyl-D-alanine-endopeptidase [Zoogloeaceae bacterium]|jgi:D-alanyl-D-alanine carboxypeptidase/D-alanyl-D-alanine-endopeptidase (penicillin-binding protein 4)|nr:D-alanyl-D-alanine carboxypeptidase/D-alanyl-D-alanine-endopeptidase [Zoogloeaceae bacterium]
MTRRLCVLFCLLCAPGFSPVPACAQNLPPVVAKALRSVRIPDTAVAVAVHALDSGGRPARASHNARVGMNPASAMKLLTTYAALEILGPTHTWRTTVWLDHPPEPDGRLRGNLYLKGGGDPKLVLESFWLLLRQLRTHGVQHIEGDLVLDRSVFVAPPHDPATFDKRPLRAYNVGPDGLLLDFHALRFTLTPENGGIGVRQETPLAGLALETRLTPVRGGCDGWRDRLNMRYIPGSASNSDRFILDGPYPLACGRQTLALALLPADRHAEGIFRALWRELGGTLRGHVRSGAVPPGAALLTQQDSPTVAEIIRDVNKWSNNVMARQVFLALGNDPTARTEEKSRRRIVDWLRQKGLDFPELVVENGAGLSRRARISAENLTRLLVAAWQSPFMPEFVASLPIAGIDGTMQTRLRQTLAQGRARVKTGTLDGVKAAAGYVQDTYGQRYAVSFLINHPRAAVGGPAIDALLLWVTQGCP